MTRIDFYILPEASAEAAPVTATKLCDKAAAQNLRVYIHAGAAQAAELDSLLWTLRQGSFLAHEAYAGQAVEEPPPAILIGSVEPPETHHDVLINLTPEVPPFFSRFGRVLEIVSGDAAERARSRERFKFYRDRGYELKTHNL